jgi:hypothetical protein
MAMFPSLRNLMRSHKDHEQDDPDCGHADGCVKPLEPLPGKQEADKRYRFVELNSGAE